MRTTRLVTLTAVALVIGLAAPASAADVALTDAQLAGAVLVATDVPDAGWGAAAAGTLEPEPHTQANDVEGGWCGGATDAYTAGELHTTGSATTILSKNPGADEPFWFVWESLYSFEPAFGNTGTQQAKAFMKAMKAAVTSCPSWTAAGEPINSITPAVVPIATVGKQRLAVHLTIAGDGVTSEAGVAYVRVANNVVVVHTRILPSNPALVFKIVKRAVKKLRAAAAAA